MNNNVRTYRDLIVWSDSKLLAEKVYNVTKYLPSEERFGLASQMQRAAVSIPSNIAEGEQRNSTKDYIRFLYTSRGSLAELLTQLEITKDLYPELESLIIPLINSYNILGKKLNNLIISLKRRLKLKREAYKKKKLLK